MDRTIHFRGRGCNGKSSAGIFRKMAGFGVRLILVVVISWSGTSGRVGVDGRRTSTSSYSLSDILDDLDLNSDNRIRPGYGEKVLEIHAFAFLRNVIEINEVESTMTVNLLLMQMWDDPRVAFSPGVGQGIKEILIDNVDFMSRLWNPDTFIVNEVRSHGCASRPNLSSQILRLSHTGSILKTLRLTVTVSCPMRHKNYPFHSFECDIEIESFGHKTEDILFIWRNGSKSVDYSNVDRASLAGKSSYVLTSVQSHSQQSYLDTGGSYSKLLIRLHFSKLWLRHAITFFIPTVVVTVCSLLSLWIISNSSVGIITNFIIGGLIILLGGLEYSGAPLLTQVPFLTPVDVHLGICVSAVFSAVTFHGISLCLEGKERKSQDSTDGDDQEDDARPTVLCRSSALSREKFRKKRRHKSTETEESDKDEHDTEKFLGKKQSGLEGNNRGSYKYFDVTNGALEREADKESSSVVVEERRTEGKKKKVRGIIEGILRASLTVSKWVTLCSFVVTESVFWYNYLVLE